MYNRDLPLSKPGGIQTDIDGYLPTIRFYFCKMFENVQFVEHTVCIQNLHKGILFYDPNNFFPGVSYPKNADFIPIPKIVPHKSFKQKH
jgi:hypothetical protein